MNNYTYTLESFYLNRWLKMFQGSRQYCQGFFDARQDYSPRPAYRIVRSDGKIIQESKSDDSVRIGQIASWPTAEQYENAAKDALERAYQIRERSKIRAKD